jgi:hypothetical protein
VALNFQLPRAAFLHIVRSCHPTFLAETSNAAAAGRLLDSIAMAFAASVLAILDCTQFAR